MIQIDARGEVCPTPLMLATKALKEAPDGEALEILIDYSPALDTIPPQAKRLGWNAEVTATGESEWSIVLTRRA